MLIQEENNKKLLTEINVRLKEILSFDIEKDLIRSEALGSTLNFLECKDVFINIILSSKELSESDISNLPFFKVNVLDEQIKEILAKLNSIRKFNPETQSAERKNLINQIKNSYQNFYTQVFDILIFIKLQKIKPSKIEEQVKNNLRIVEDASNKSGQKLKEINEILSKTKQIAGKTGVVEYAKDFNNESNEHEKKSKYWFGGVVFMSLFVASLGLFLMFQIKKDLSTGEAIQYSIAKFIVLSAFFYALVWTTKNYNAHRHNYIVNKHRANSLNSFETFVKSTEDLATKDAVLLQATQSIFSQQPTGYDNNDSEGDTSNKFIEILRHIEPKK